MTLPSNGPRKGISWQLSVDESKSRVLGNQKAGLAVAVSVVIMAYGSHLGFLSIIVFLAIWLPLLLNHGRLVISVSRYSLCVALLLLWSLASASWSNYPAISLKKAAEYASLVLCSLVMAERVSGKAFIRGLVLGCSIVLVTTLINGKYSGDPFTGRYSLVGLLGSKNTVGFIAEVLVLASLHSWKVSKRIRDRIAFCILPFLLSVACLVQSKSATSIVSLVGAIGLMCALLVISKLPRGMRVITFFFVAVWGMVLAGVGFALEWHLEVLRFFGKSTTLTGRTDLWAKGLAYGADSPIVGHGYGAFWVHGHIPAEHLWYKFGIWHRAGFHFHNLFVQSFVDLGAIGALLLAFLLLGAVVKPLMLCLREGLVPEYSLGCLLSTTLLIRAYTEVDIMGTYSTGPLIFFSLYPLVSTRLKRQRKLSRQQAGDVPTTDNFSATSHCSYSHARSQSQVSGLTQSSK